MNYVPCFFSFLPRGYNTLKISFHILEPQNSFYRDRFSPFFIQNTSTAFSTDTRIFSSIKQSTNENFTALLPKYTNKQAKPLKIFMINMRRNVNKFVLLHADYYQQAENLQSAC